MYMVAMTTIMLLYIMKMCFTRPRALHKLRTVGRSLYCVPNVLFLASVVTLVSKGNGWSWVGLYLEVSLG